jgi:hypothetical protein
MIDRVRQSKRRLRTRFRWLRRSCAKSMECSPMTNRWGISLRVLRNATKYDIPDRIVRHVARRDQSCVYCKLRYRIGTHSRKNLASWEHLDHNSLNHPQMWNIALCCGGCNSSRGPKGLAEWFDSAYCRNKKISKRTVAPVIRRYLGRGLRGL